MGAVSSRLFGIKRSPGILSKLFSSPRVCIPRRALSGSNIGPGFADGDNPSRDDFKTEADVVKFVQQAVAHYKTPHRTFRRTSGAGQSAPLSSLSAPS